MAKFIGTLAIAFALFFFLLAAPIADGLINRVEAPSVAPEPAAVEAMGQMFVADLHADSLLWGRDLIDRNTRGSVDVPRLIEGQVALQFFTVVSKTPLGLNIERNEADTADMITLLAIAQLWPLNTWGSLFERAIYQAQRFDGFVEQSGGRLVPIRTRRDLSAFVDRRGSDPNLVAGILGIEGLQVLQGDASKLTPLVEAGFRMMAPTHFFDTALGGSAHGVSKGGLTEFGRDIIGEMERQHVLLDLAHASPKLIDDVLAIATKPVVVSHTGVRGTCDNQRNLSDEHIRGIAKTGGVIGIGYWETAVCGMGPAAIAKAIDYVVKLVGVDHVGLGSDYDGAVAVPFDTTRLDLIVSRLMKSGHDHEVISKIMGGNVLRVVGGVLPP